MKNLFLKFSETFHKLPGPLKAIFYVSLNGVLVLLARDLEALQKGNEYLSVILGGLGNMLLYMALYIGAKSKEESDN